MKTPASLSEIERFTLHASDGLVGKVKEFFFDDATWNVRYAVVELGSWLNSREVIVPASALGRPDLLNSLLPVSLTKDQIEKCPASDEDMPLERRREDEMKKLSSQGIFYSWGEGFIGSHNLDIPEYERSESLKESGNSGSDVHLRSSRFLRGGEAIATDGRAGHVRDFIVDSESWTIRDIVLEIGTLFDTKMVLIPRQWVRRISIDNAEFVLNVEKEKVNKSAVFNYHDLEQEMGSGLTSLRR